MINKNQPPQLLKGFRDYYPEQMAFRTWLYNQAKSVAESFGFQEYEGPIVETLDLYAAKSGEELVKKQAFTMQDKSGNMLALRPEMTPSLARMVAQKSGSLTFPVKWFSFGPRFRYETPQRGRGREFFQWDVDILGSDSPNADAEVLAMAATMYQRLGLTPREVKIRVNDRQYLQTKLASIGVDSKRTVAIFGIIDRKEKVSESVFEEMLRDEGVSRDQIQQLTDTLQNSDALRSSPWIKQILQTLELLGLIEFVECDPGTVRGLDYYTRTVFEGWDATGKFRSIWGGGRYDNLTEEVGGKQRIPGVGFAMGDMMIEEILRQNNKFPVLSALSTNVLVTVFSEEFLEKSLSLSQSLRSSSINTDLYPDPTVKLDKQLKYADKKGIPFVVILGPEEAANGTATIKDMRKQSQQTVPLAKLTDLLRE